jgi:REP element-mobilizing transposase RayT
MISPDKHRRSIRLGGYDYAQAGAYFVTICTHDRACLFGDVVDGVMCLNDAGRMVQSVWDELPVYYPGVETDAFVVMPNHVHGILVFVGAPLVGAQNGVDIRKAMSNEITDARKRGQNGVRHALLTF